MSNAHIFISGFLFSLSLCFDLGMVNVAIMKTGIERGFKPSFLIGFGSCFGDLFYLSLALLGVSVVFEIEPVRWALWIAGSCFLLYLTGKMLYETWRPKRLNAGSDQASAERSPFKDWLTGAGLAIVSPTVIAWFALVAGPIVVDLELNGAAQLAVFVSGFFVAGMVWSLFVAAVGSLSGAMFKSQLVRMLSLASALLFLYFAIKVFVGGLQDVMG